MQDVIDLFLALLLAHLLADFPLQTDSIASGKRNRRVRSYFEHGLIHFVVAIVCIALFARVNLLSYRVWGLLLAYIAVHLLIDVFKEKLVCREALADNATSFVCDQLLHVLTILGVSVVLVMPNWLSLKSRLTWSAKLQHQVLVGALVYVAVVFAGGYLIRYLTRSLAAKVQADGETQEEVRNAGLYIGWLERFLVVSAVVAQSPSMVGLILTGKSIARFPELKEAKFAEYFLIGTFLSVSVALVGGFVLLKSWYGTISLK